MSFWDWLRNLFRPTVERDVSRLEVPANAVDAVHESVDLTGKPLKKDHLRRGFRDPRLLPKKAPLIRIRKRPPWMPFAEACRLFSATLRTRNRAIRDLVHDEEQLRRLGLPVWKTEEELAAALGLEPGTLRHFSIHRERETAPHYVTFSIPKRDGTRRLIMAPKRRLKEILRKLHELLVIRLPVHAAAHGFRRGRSVKTNAEPHVGKAFLVHMDVRDFFPTLHVGRVRGYLIALGYGYPVATVLATLMTEAERQPVEIEGRVFHVPVGFRHCVQGAPTSPGLANAIFLRADRRLYKLSEKLGFVYTRYADDLTFSGDDPNGAKTLCRLVPRILQEEGFEINPGKTRIMRASGRQRIAGVTVNRTLGLSRKERRVIRAMIHRMKTHTEAASTGLSNSSPVSDRSRLWGKIAWVRMLNADQGSRLKALFEGSSPPAEKLLRAAGEGGEDRRVFPGKP